MGPWQRKRRRMLKVFNMIQTFSTFPKLFPSTRSWRDKVFLRWRAEKILVDSPSSSETSLFAPGTSSILKCKLQMSKKLSDQRSGGKLWKLKWKLPIVASAAFQFSAAILHVPGEGFLLTPPTSAPLFPLMLYGWLNFHHFTHPQFPNHNLGKCLGEPCILFMASIHVRLY